MAINHELADERGVSTENRSIIKYLHLQIQLLFDMSYSLPSDVVVFELEQLEYRLQDMWGFDRDRSYHSYWYRSPGCTCPKMDNRERKGYGRIIAGNCPYHGHTVATKKEEPKKTDKQVGGKHYDLAIQPIDYIELNNLGYCEGNVVKYATRHASKNGAEDIKKAIHYLEFILKYQYGE